MGMFRRSSADSGFGSVGDPDEALEREKEIHAKEKISILSIKEKRLKEELENQLHTLRSKIVLLEGRLDIERERARRLEQERDEAVSSAGRAMNEVEALKSENRALKAEIANLKRHVQEASRNQHQVSVKERIKEQVDAERKKDLTHRTRVQDEKKISAERSFVQVCRYQCEANPSLLRSRNCGKRLNLFGRLVRTILPRNPKPKRKKRQRNRWKKSQKTPRGMYR